MARRRKASILDDLLSISIRIPFWANLIIASGTFAALRVYGGPEFPAMGDLDASHLADALALHFATVAAHIAQYIIPPIFLLGGIMGWIQRKARARRYNKISSSPLTGQAIRNLSWEQFEQMVGEAFRRQGFTVNETSKGADGGIDLVMRKGGELFLVQCKQWKAVKVSVQVVRELYGVMSARGAVGGFVVTTGSYTADATRFAKGTSLELIDGVKLSQMFKSTSSESTYPPGGHQMLSASVQSDAVLPQKENYGRQDMAPPISIYEAAKLVTCPRCSGGMTPRFSKGQSSGVKGRAFFGCLTFPRCRGTRQLAELPSHITVEP